MILYFTGTGNSRYIAEKIAAVTGDELVSMNDRIKKNNTAPIYAEHRLVFVTPTYGWRIPRIVEKWIRETDFSGTDKVWFVMNCGDEIGNAAKYIKQLCKEKQFTCMGTAEIIMPENYIAMFDTPEPKEAKAIIRRADPDIENTAKMIADEQTLPEIHAGFVDKVKSGIINTVFYPVCIKADAFQTDDKCVGCGKCVELCPLNNIRLRGRKPVWGKNCTHCMACISYCPTQAIEYGKKSFGKPRYRCNAVL